MKELVERADWDTLELEWLEAVSERNCSLDEMLKTADLVAEKDRKRAVLLLNLLMEELVEHRETGSAERVLARALDLAPANEELRSQLESLLIVQYGERPYFRRFVEYAGIRENTDPRKSWKTFRSLLRITPGRFVYHHGWSAGKVTDIDIIAEEITVDFVEKPDHVMRWSMALKSLDSIPSDHIQAYMVDRRDKLRAMEPVSLLGLAIRSGGGDMDPKQIRSFVEPVLREGGWTSWWAKARSQAESEPRIRPTMTRPVRYRWADEDAPDENEEKRREILSMNLRELLGLSTRVREQDGLNTLMASQIRRRLTPRTKNPLLRLEAWLLLAELGDNDAESEIEAVLSSVDDPISLVMGLKSSESKKRALTVWERIDGENREKRNAKLFFAAESSRDRHLIVAEMTHDEKERLVWSVLRQLPEQGLAFFWLVEQADKGFPFPYPKPDRLVTLLQLLNESPGLRTPVTSFLEHSSLLTEALNEIDVNGAERLMNALNETEISVSLKKELTETIVDSFPELKQDDDHILATSDGLKRREIELRQLVKVELPENKRAIAEAMAHGDLRENFEYKAAKEQQERILARISELESQISRVRLIQPQAVDIDAVNPGVTVTITDEEGRSSDLTILGPWDSDPEEKVFSYRAPGVRPLMGKRVNERVELSLDTWEGEYSITGIRVWRSV